jgi:hypothetical protein
MKENTKGWLPNDSHTFWAGHGLPSPKGVAAYSCEGFFFSLKKKNINIFKKV